MLGRRINQEIGVEPLDTTISGKIEGGLPNELPVLTAYVIRHGETTEDKLNPKRGLTERGEKQAYEAAEKLISELDPQRDIIQLLDSGNFRANATVMRIAEKLKSVGFSFFQPISIEKSGRLKSAQTRPAKEPRSQTYERAIGAANIPDEFKKMLNDPELHERLGIPKDISDKRIMAWFLMKEDGLERPEDVRRRVFEGIRQSQNQVSKIAEAFGPGKRVVTIVAGNNSMIESVVSDIVEKTPVVRGSEVENCEGFKVDFTLSEEPKVGVWGEKIEKIDGNRQ